MAILTVENLHKNYGPIQALKGVSFSVPKGSVFGILGPNGSGKTTLLGIVLNVLKASSGSFKLFDEEPSHVHRQQIGTLLETPNFYHYLNAVQNLTIAATIKQRGSADINRVLELVNLEQRKFSKFSTYSLGMKQRLAIASSLLGDPDVLIFDEPTNGLDPVGIAETRELIKKLHQAGKTIIMASHLLDEVEKVCTHVAILQKGTLLTHGHVDEILITDEIVETGAANLQQLQNILQQYPGAKRVYVNDQHVELTFAAGTASLEALNRYCFEHGITLHHLRLRKKSLETKFFELTQNTK
ncbi:ABC transporter ATP-binding protein [Niastella yeongjuensis]|uniref:ABC transporter ATP-binding protein n=1 Tax=Niastella yeongjuensis TaxID=354355 RepID=A0A1V9ENS2_9BACT|nr:ATP-binding cassette domain-containing protein [Niastella yeongjuensis]OQP47780.1 ABC transporter ATP-binding protein [Niastella yeongjuensis]SEP45281.1 ABC-2 type transport system ATP-binding protein [Niastella yeongjuensis]